MNFFIKMLILLIIFCFENALFAQDKKPSDAVPSITPTAAAAQKTGSISSSNKRKDLPTSSERDNILRRPGEITFTVGAIIEGKVEKPQVIIIFPKERSKTDSIYFDHSFRNEMLKPLKINAYKAVSGK